MFDYIENSKSINKSKGQLVTSIKMPEDSPREKNSPKRRKNSPEKPIQRNEPLKQQYNNQNYLQDELKNSQKYVKYAEREAIGEKMQNRQVITHGVQSGRNEGKFLGELYEASHKENPYMKRGIEETVQDIQTKVSEDINKKYKVHRKAPKNKDDLKELQKVDRYRMLKIKNGEIKNKVGNLRDDLEREYYSKKKNLKLPDHQNIRQSDYYSLENPRTHEASHFVNHIQERRRVQKKKYEEYLMMKKEEEQIRKQRLKEQKRREKDERRLYLEEEYSRNLEKRHRDREILKRKKEEIKEWSKIFQKEKPLYVRKEEEYIENYIIPQIEDKREKLLEKKLQNRPIDMEQINDHDFKYMEYKKDDVIRKEAYLEMIREQNELNEADLDQLYKGQHRYNVLQEMYDKQHEQDPKNIQRIKKARQIVYGDQIKQKVLEKSRKMETLDTERNNRKQFKKRTRNINGSLTVDHEEEGRKKNPKQDGKQYLHYMKNLVKEKGVRKESQNQIVSQKINYPNYMHELHERRQSQSLGQKSQKQTHSLSTSNDLDSMKARAQKFDERLRRNEMRKKHKFIGNEEDANMQKQQLTAIKAKLNLLNQIN